MLIHISTDKDSIGCPSNPFLLHRIVSSDRHYGFPLVEGRYVNPWHVGLQRNEGVKPASRFFLRRNENLLE